MQNPRTHGGRAGRSEAGHHPAGPDEEPRYPISSVDNALKLLLVLREQRFIRVGEASELLGVVRSTAHRLLAMLLYRGFVRQDPESKAYTAGPALLDIGLSVVRQMDIRQHLRPYLERLSIEVSETVHLIVLDGANCLFIESVESTRALRTSSRVGRRFPAHVTSGGKVLLAELPAARLNQLYPLTRLPRVSPNSIEHRAELESELARIRQQGYAMNRGESEPEIGAIAVAVRNSFGQAVAAVAVSVPLSRLHESAVPGIAKTMVGVVEDAADQLL